MMWRWTKNECGQNKTDILTCRYLLTTSKKFRFHLWSTKHSDRRRRKYDRDQRCNLGLEVSISAVLVHVTKGVCSALHNYMYTLLKGRLRWGEPSRGLPTLQLQTAFLHRTRSQRHQWPVALLVGWGGSVGERRSLTGELSLVCTGLAADG